MNINLEKAKKEFIKYTENYDLTNDKINAIITSQAKTKSKISVFWRTFYHNTSQKLSSAALHRLRKSVGFSVDMV